MVEVFQMTKEQFGDSSDWPDWLDRHWRESSGVLNSMFRLKKEGNDIYYVRARGGIARKVLADDWIIRCDGRLHVCGPDVFAVNFRTIAAGQAVFV